MLKPRLWRPFTLVTSTAAAVETNSAGIWLTRPSPMVSLEKRSPASTTLSPPRVPMATPPIRLRVVMIRPAMASPRTNLEAPSMAP